MRIHPATGFILERRAPPGGITLHGVHLPEDTIVGVNSWAIHRNKSIFGEDVHTFRPERWIEGDEEAIKEMKRNLFTVSSHVGLTWVTAPGSQPADKLIFSLDTDLGAALARIFPSWRCGKWCLSCTGILTLILRGIKSGRSMGPGLPPRVTSRCGSSQRVQLAEERDGGDGV